MRFLWTRRRGRMDFLRLSGVVCRRRPSWHPQRGAMLRSILPAAAVACLILVAADAGAQDKSQYTLFNPTPTDKMRDFNTDRPTKSNVPYTVDAGHFQYEGDIFIYGFDNTSTPDTNITSWVIGNPTFKLGLLNNMDFEVNFSTYNSIRSQTRSDGSTTTFTGCGDTITRANIRLWCNDGGSAAIASTPDAQCAP